MEPKWNQIQYQSETNTKKNPENLVPKPWYREVGIQIEVPEPVLWQRRNRGFSTKTGTELKNQYCINTSSCPRYTTFQICANPFFTHDISLQIQILLPFIKHHVLCLKV